METGNRILFVAAFLSAGIIAGCNRSDSATALPAAAYVGTRTTHTIHKAGCGFIGRAKPANRVPFDHLADAIAEGYRPCKHCLPAASTKPAITPEEKP